MVVGIHRQGTAPVVDARICRVNRTRDTIPGRTQRMTEILTRTSRRDLHNRPLQSADGGECADLAGQSTSSANLALSACSTRSA
jgi:hypothetical protein